jgi:hypothetical protein
VKSFNVQKSVDFWKTTFEKECAVFRRNVARTKFFDGIMTFTSFSNLLERREEDGECLTFGMDVNAMRYVDGQRENLAVGGDADVLDKGTAEEWHMKGVTFQARTPSPASPGSMQAKELRCFCFYS